MTHLFDTVLTSVLSVALIVDIYVNFRRWRAAATQVQALTAPEVNAPPTVAVCQKRQPPIPGPHVCDPRTCGGPAPAASPPGAVPAPAASGSSL